MTIDELLAATGLTANDLVPIYDAEAAQNVEPTQKITAAQLAAAVKVLADLQGKLTFDSTPTTGSNNPVTSGGVADAIAQSTAYVAIVATPSGHYNYVDVERTVNGITYNKIIAGIMSNANYTVIAYLVSATTFRIICRNAPDGASPASSVSVCYALFV